MMISRPLQRRAAAGQRLGDSDGICLRMRSFKLDFWYGGRDELPAEEEVPWVSPWASSHKKLRAQEMEIEQCELLMRQAAESEDYAEAQGLAERMERLRSRHPLIWREERLEEALRDEDYASMRRTARARHPRPAHTPRGSRVAVARIFANDLEAVRRNLGLPRFNLGQVVRHRHRPDLRGIVIDVDLVCRMPDEWVNEAGCIERALALGVPTDECVVDALDSWRKQPFYTVFAAAGADGDMPSELQAWHANRFDARTPPLYLAEAHVDFSAADEPVEHPQLEDYFDGHVYHPHRGRQYRPNARLRLWQRQLLKAKEASLRAQRVLRVGRGQ